MSATTDTVLVVLNAALPGATAREIKFALYEIVGELCRDVLQVAGPTDVATELDSWITEEQWDRYQRLIIDGVLARMYGAASRPYSNGILATAHFQYWTDALAAARSGTPGPPDPFAEMMSDLIYGQAGVEAAAVPDPVSPIARILENCRTRLPGAIDSGIKQELFNAVDELCRVSRCWRQNTPLQLDIRKKAYVVAPTGTEVVQVVSVQHNSLDMSAVKYSYGSIYLRDYPAEKDTDFPAFVTMHLAPSPLNVDPEDWLPVELLMRHVQTLVDGVCMRMMSQAGKPFSNPTFAQYHGRRFRNAMAQANIDMRGRDVMGQPTWRFPRFAR